MLANNAVIIGLGYVGLPVAIAACGSGFNVTGLDTSSKICSDLNQGKSHIDDITSNELNSILKKGFKATTEPECISEADYIVICVPTPLDENQGPDLSAVRNSAIQIGKYIKRGSTVILESTTYPGTTEEVVKPLIELHSNLLAGSDFHLAFSPERIDPGNKKFQLSNTPKIVGGLTRECTQKASYFYRHFVETVIEAKNLKVAETSKLLENTYRHVNIALVNEMAKFCHEMEIDFWNVVECASTKPFGFHPFYPGPGVGGHCIPIDPNYLSFKVKSDLGYSFKFVELAEEINASMPNYIFERVQDLLNDLQKSVKKAKILVLGITYKENISDLRETPASAIVKKLLRKGATVEFHDPYIEEWFVDSQKLQKNTTFPNDLTDFDLVILLQAHREYLAPELFRSAQIVFDARGKLSGDNVVKL